MRILVGFLILMSAVSGRADTFVSGLPRTTKVAPTDLVVVNTNGAAAIASQQSTRTITVQDLGKAIAPGLTNLPVQSALSSNVNFRVDALYDTNHLTVSGTTASGANTVYTMKLPFAGCRVWTNNAGTWGICERDAAGCGAAFSLTNSAGATWSGYFASGSIADPQSSLPVQCTPNPWRLFDGLDCLVSDGTMCVTAPVIGSVNFVTRTNIAVTVYQPNGFIELLNATHVGANYPNQTKSAAFPLLYVTNGEGIIRSIEFTSDSVDSWLDARTNYSLRIYTDSGPIADLNNLPSQYLNADIPLASLMLSKYWSYFRSNYVGPLAFGTRYVGWAEMASNSSAFGIGHWTFTFRYPAPFTNSALVTLWDNKNNVALSSGFSFVSCERGTVPDFLRTVRLRSYRANLTNNAAGGTNVLVLDWPYGEGEVASLFVSVRNPGGGNAFWEGVWYQTPDYILPRQAFGCAGGEDMFNNGYYLDAVANSTWDWGTRYIHKVGTDDYIAECYRHFYGADTHHWFAAQNVIFQIPAGFSSIQWDSLMLFYGRK